MIADQLSDPITLSAGEPKAITDLDRHSRANLCVIVEANSVFDLKCLGLTDIVQKNAQSQRNRWIDGSTCTVIRNCDRRPIGCCGVGTFRQIALRFIHQLKHQKRMYPDVPFRMELGRLLNTLQVRDLRQYWAQQSQGFQQLKTTAGIAFCKDLGELVAKPLFTDLQDLVSERLNGVARLCFQLESIA